MSMSNAQQARERIAAQAAQWVARRDAGLGAEERAEFARWCAADPRHASAVAHYAAAWSALDRPRQAGAILRELHGRVRRRRQAIAGAAAAVLVAATVAWQWRQPRATEPATVAAAPPGGVLLAPERRTLADGSIVELDRGAEIAVDFAPSRRRVVLVRGAGHFQVVKDPDRPFVVEVGGMQVRAVGTVFSVERGALQFEVLVTEGRIAVERVVARPEARGAQAREPARAASEILASVGAGERVVVPAQPPATPPAVVAASPDEIAERLGWRARRVEFSDTPLAEAVATINRAARAAGGPRIEIDPRSRGLSREPVSGVFRVDNVEAFVRVLELSLGVKTERHGNRIVMRSLE